VHEVEGLEADALVALGVRNHPPLSKEHLSFPPLLTDVKLSRSLLRAEKVEGISEFGSIVLLSCLFLYVDEAPPLASRAWLSEKAHEGALHVVSSRRAIEKI
jgi:hypothetical protein